MERIPLPDGEWSFEDWIDDDGVDYDKPIRLFVTMTKRGDHMIVDWTGTDPQVKGAINNTYSFTKAASYTAIRSVLPSNIPSATPPDISRSIDPFCRRRSGGVWPAFTNSRRPVPGWNEARNRVMNLDAGA